MDFKVIATTPSAYTVVLRVQEPTTLEWIEMDGLGAVPIQVAKGSNPMAFDAIIPNAVQKNLPAAESFALKDAAEKLGKVFGSDLNRKDEIAFRSVYAEWVNTEAKEKANEPARQRGMDTGAVRSLHRIGDPQTHPVRQGRQ